MDELLSLGNVYRINDPKKAFLVRVDNTLCIQINLDKLVVIKGYILSHKMEIYCIEGNKIIPICCIMETPEILDLDDEGVRWEGNSLNEEMCGWGKLYGVSNELLYEGFMFKNHKVCYGVIYHSDIGLI